MFHAQGEDAPAGVPRAPVVIALGLLVFAGVASIAGTFTSAEADRLLARSLEIRQAEAELFSAVQDAETGQRGYLLTADPGYLRPLLASQSRLELLEAKLHRLSRDDSRQQGRLSQLDTAIAAKMAELERTIALERGGRGAEAVAMVKTDEGRDLMQRIRELIAQFDAVERETLRRREADDRTVNLAVAGAVSISIGLVALLALAIARAGRAYEAALKDRNRALAAEMAERAAAQAQLRQAQKMESLGQLTGGVAHDFNNMLAVIVGNLDILIRRAPPEDRRLAALAENALAAAHRASALTRSLLAFSRLQPLDPKPTDVNKCVSDITEMLRRSLGERISVETVLGGGLWHAYVDRPQLESALLNLAVNARDAMPDGGHLTVETSNASLDPVYAEGLIDVEPGQYVLLSVTDTGSGMSPEVLEKAFDPFFTTKGVGEGTGLGLSQVHGFLKQSRGHIRIYSETGVGTTVKLYLPRDRSGRPAETPGRTAASIPIDQRFTVLVVEDDPGVRRIAVSAVRELGFGSLEAGTGAAALEHLKSHDGVTVLLTDVVMPEMDGRQLAEAAVRLRPDLRVLYMTGYTRNAIVHNGALDANIHLITKPFTISDLDRELRRLLRDKL
jgi:signal transduction histidine kinase/ActR/RegA family two-component response regulator